MSIEASVGELRGKLDMLIKIVEEGDRKSSSARADMRDKIDDISKQIDELQTSVAKLASRVTVIEPFVERASKWEQRGIGAIAAVGMIAGAVGSMLTYFRDSIRSFFHI